LISKKISGSSLDTQIHVLVKPIKYKM